MTAGPVACGGQAFDDAGSGGSAGASGGAAGASGSSAGSGGSMSVGGSSGSGGAAGVGGGVAGSAGSTGGVGGAGGAPPCPSSVPSHGAACVSDGLVCSYDQGPCCPAHEARCADGAWSAEIWSCNPPPPDPCPADPPAPGSACGSLDPCGNSFSDCWWDCPGGGQSHARCDGSSWQFDSTCSKPADCSGEVAALTTFAGAHRSCVTSSDCVAFLGPCADGADFCDGTFYVNRAASSAEFQRLSGELLACLSVKGFGCVACDAIAPPPACLGGKCGGAF